MKYFIKYTEKEEFKKIFAFTAHNVAYGHTNVKGGNSIPWVMGMISIPFLQEESCTTSWVVHSPKTSPVLID